MGKTYKRIYRGNRDKYSVEHTAFRLEIQSAGSYSQLIVPAATLSGMRKVKHLTISMASPAAGAGDHAYWALVYVPQGTTPGSLNPGGSLYEPNQFVMSSGVFDFSAGPLRVRSPLSRNLNSGDAIYLVVNVEAAGLFYGVVQYAVTLQ